MNQVFQRQKQLAHKMARGLVCQPALLVELLTRFSDQHFWLEHNGRLGACKDVSQMRLRA